MITSCIILYYIVMDTSSNSSGDEFIIEFVSGLELLRKHRIFHNRTDHFIKWDENEFYSSFRLSKRCVNILILDLIAL